MASTQPPDFDAGDAAAWGALAAKVDAVPMLGPGPFDAAYVDEGILRLVRASLERLDRRELLRDDVDPSRAFVKRFSPAVLMFGGVSPELGAADVDRLCGLLASREDGGGDASELSRLVALSGDGPAIGLPHEDGYALAQDFLEESGVDPSDGWIDIRGIASELGIEILEETLATDTIRGVAIAGEGFRSTILVNAQSPYNKVEAGKRFTVAHELCHILHDRTRARRITHVSGPWVAPGIERRANAFAAYVLMPRQLVWRLWTEHRGAGQPHRDAVTDIAGQLRVSERALVEHLYNIEAIDEFERERLRGEMRIH